MSLAVVVLEGVSSYGSATLMRGKSPTCRHPRIPLSQGLRPVVVDRQILWRACRQVGDLPRIRVAEPWLDASAHPAAKPVQRFQRVRRIQVCILPCRFTRRDGSF